MMMRTEQFLDSLGVSLRATFAKTLFRTPVERKEQFGDSHHNGGTTNM